MSQEEYAKHILALCEDCVTYTGVVSKVMPLGIEIESDPEHLAYLRWPNAQYELLDRVLIVIPPDDYAVAIPLDRTKWPMQLYLPRESTEAREREIVVVGKGSRNNAG